MSSSKNQSTVNPNKVISLYPGMETGKYTMSDFKAEQNLQLKTGRDIGKRFLSSVNSNFNKSFSNVTEAKNYLLKSVKDSKKEEIKKAKEEKRKMNIQKREEEKEQKKQAKEEKRKMNIQKKAEIKKAKEVELTKDREEVILNSEIISNGKISTSEGKQLIREMAKTILTDTGTNYLLVGTSVHEWGRTQNFSILIDSYEKIKTYEEIFESFSGGGMITSSFVNSYDGPLVDFSFSKASVIYPLQLSKRKHNDKKGQFFRYYNDSEFDLTPLQIYNKTQYESSSTRDIPCLKFVCQEIVKYMNRTGHNIDPLLLETQELSLIFNRLNIETKQLTKIADKLGIQFELYLYSREGKKNTKRYPVRVSNDRLLVKIALFENHYFLNDYDILEYYLLPTVNDLHLLEIGETAEFRQGNNASALNTVKTLYELGYFKEFITAYEKDTQTINNDINLFNIENESRPIQFNTLFKDKFMRKETTTEIEQSQFDNSYKCFVNRYYYQSKYRENSLIKGKKIWISPYKRIKKLMDIAIGLNLTPSNVEINTKEINEFEKELISDNGRFTRADFFKPHHILSLYKKAVDPNRNRREFKRLLLETNEPLLKCNSTDFENTYIRYDKVIQQASELYTIAFADFESYTYDNRFFPYSFAISKARSPISSDHSPVVYEHYQPKSHFSKKKCKELSAELVSKLFDHLIELAAGKQEIKVYFHNLKFDISQIINYSPYPFTSRITKDSMVYSYKFKIKINPNEHLIINMVDSCKLYAGKLENFAKDMDLDCEKGYQPYRLFDIKHSNFWNKPINSTHFPIAFDKSKIKGNTLLEHNEYYNKLDTKILRDSMNKFKTLIAEICESTFKTCEYFKHFFEFIPKVNLFDYYTISSIADLIIGKVFMLDSLLRHDIKTMENKCGKELDLKKIYLTRDNCLLSVGAKVKLSCQYECNGYLQSFIQKFVKGGVCSSRDNKCIDIITTDNERIIDMDVNSLYPASFKDLAIQISKFRTIEDRAKLIGDPSEKECEKECEKLIRDPLIFYQANVKAKSFEYDIGLFKTLSKSISNENQKSVLASPSYGDYVNEYEGELFINSRQLAEYKASGVTFQKFEVINAIECDYINDNYIFEKLKNLYELRQKYKKQGKNGLQLMIKLILNSSYGKFITKSNPAYERVYHSKEKLLEAMESRNYIRSEIIGKSYVLFCPDSRGSYNRQISGISILNQSKKIMYDAQRAIINYYGKGRILYQDTDSFHIHLTHEEAKEIGDVINVSKKLGEFSSDFGDSLYSIEFLCAGKKIYSDMLFEPNPILNYLNNDEAFRICPDLLMENREDKLCPISDKIKYHQRCKGIPSAELIHENEKIKGETHHNNLRELIHGKKNELKFNISNSFKFTENNCNLIGFERSIKTTAIPI